MIWSIFLCFFVTTIVANEENARSASFVIWQNKRLASEAVLKIHSSSLVSCNQACLRLSWCTSTNFKESFDENSKGSCELNKLELSTIQHDAKLTDQAGNTFTTILQVGENVSFKSDPSKVILITVRPILSGHPRDFEKWPLMNGLGMAVNMILLTLYSKMLLKSEHI